MNRNWGTQRTPTVGAELKRLRASHRWSLRTLGEKSHLDYSYLSRIEKGERRASPEVVETLDAVLEANGRLIDAWATENDVARPAQLPAAPVRFVGRDAQLAELETVLSRQPATSPAVITIDGPAGAGKTALALRCAHDHAGQFFDGQLYCDLGGFAASRTDAVDPSTVLKWFCIALGAEPSTIPLAATERAALYRSLLADRRVLVVLDNAADSRHVEYLLPGTGRCAVIVTSRRVLSGLTALADAHRVPVGPLRESDSVALIGQLVGIERAERDHRAVLALTHLCGHLPLALRIAAERVVARPELPIQTLVGDLTVRRRRLDYLETGDLPGVRSVVSWSYSQLSTDAARMFRLLGIHGGSIVGTKAAAALAGTDINTTHRNLCELDQLHLAELESDDTVRLHELLRAYALEQTLAEDNPAERSAALDRVIRWYIQALRASLDAAGLDRTNLKMSANEASQSGRPHEHALCDIVRIAEAALENGFPGGTWHCAAALWNCLLDGHSDRIPCDTNEHVLETAPTIPRQRPRELGDHLYGQAIARRPTTADQHGLAWTLAGAALLAVCCDEDDLARDFTGQARELLDGIGEPDREAGMLRLASELLRGAGTPAALDGGAVVEVARLVAETAAEQTGVDHQSRIGTPDDNSGPLCIEPCATTTGTVSRPHDAGGN